MSALFTLLLWFPHLGGSVEAAQDIGLDDTLRGTIGLQLEAIVVQQPTWQLEVYIGHQTMVRSNRANETPFRISPEQIYYPVAARLRMPLQKTGRSWALFARHQSNHDIDTNDPVLNRETISFEAYGIQLITPKSMTELALYYDRGTRIGGRQQIWPLDYFLLGGQYGAEFELSRQTYAAGRVELVGHTNQHTPIPHLDISGRGDIGFQHTGRGGRVRFFLRLQRVSNYRFLGETPRHLLLVGLGIDGLSTSQTRAKDNFFDGMR